MFSDHQDRSGMYPDFMNDKYISYSCAKPPVYGWAYQQMISVNNVFKNVTLLEKVFDTISKFTNFWLNHRMSQQGLPFYVHGNESGWDNGTFYKEGVPVITPDLTAFLIRQLDFLAETALELGMSFESQKLRNQGDVLYEKLIEFLWKDDRFFAYSMEKDCFIDGKMTLQSLLPLIIHYRLSDDIKQSLLAQLTEQGHFLTEHGLATESLKSSDYRSDGYWRGPIWAPVMLLFTSVLEEMGESALMQDIVSRFYTCMHQNGMAENYDAIKGKGLVDPAFAWSSSVYLHYKIKYDFLKHE